MIAMISHREARRIREFLRHYFDGSTDPDNCRNADRIERHPVIVSWSKRTPLTAKVRYLAIEVDEIGIPPLHVVATDDGGGDLDGHTYTDTLYENVDAFMKRVSELDAQCRSAPVLSLYVEKELSYDIDYVSRQ